jgi:hypothetical protein
MATGRADAVDWPADTTMHSVMIPELARRGFAEGRNLVVLPRWGGNIDSEQLARLARDLAAAKPDVIIAVSPKAITAAMKAAPQTPIVASFTTDPVVEGQAASLSRPEVRSRASPCWHSRVTRSGLSFCVTRSRALTSLRF